VNASRFHGLGIGLLVVAGFVMLPIAIAIGFYSFATIQAIITGLDFSSQTLNIPVFLMVLVGTVTLSVILVKVAVVLAGRALSPKRRDEDAFEA
jgi:hypothetical protein